MESDLISTVRMVLERYVPNPKPPLCHTDPFALLIAVLLSAQCTDERVNLVTPKLFSLASDPWSMARLPVESIREIISPCGLSKRKALAIHGLSRCLVENFGGKVPTTLLELESLPGVGHKTASVVLVQAFNIPTFPVDTHIFRSAHRWGLSDKKTVRGVEDDLKTLFPENCWGKIHLQIILFARAFCRAKGHVARLCPMCRECLRFFC